MSAEHPGILKTKMLEGPLSALVRKAILRSTHSIG